MKTDDPLYEMKWRMLDTWKEEPKSAPAIDLRIKADANDIFFFRTISWLRWVNFEGDINELNASKMKAMKMAQEDFAKKGVNEEEFKK